MLVSILARPTARRSACAWMQAAPDDLNRAFASYAGEARRGGVLWEGPEPDAAFAPDEVWQICGVVGGREFFWVTATNAVLTTW